MRCMDTSCQRGPPGISRTTTLRPSPRGTRGTTAGRSVKTDPVGDPVSTMKCFSAVCRTSSGKTTYLQGRGQGGRRVTAGAGGRTPELGAVDGCAFFSGAGPGLL